MRIPKVRWSAFPLGVRYSKSGAGVVVTGTLARSSQYRNTPALTPKRPNEGTYNVIFIYLSHLANAGSSLNFPGAARVAANARMRCG
jgi:hypothetical protein